MVENFEVRFNEQHTVSTLTMSLKKKKLKPVLHSNCGFGDTTSQKMLSFFLLIRNLGVKSKDKVELIVCVVKTLFKGLDRLKEEHLGSDFI